MLKSLFLQYRSSQCFFVIRKVVVWMLHMQCNKKQDKKNHRSGVIQRQECAKYKKFTIQTARIFTPI